MSHRRIELLLFSLAWTTLRVLPSGGGWNQNGRFAMARALVEQQEPWIDDFLVYARSGSATSPVLRRIPVRDGRFADQGRSFALGGPQPTARSRRSLPTTRRMRAWCPLKRWE